MKKYLYWLIPSISLIAFIIWTVLVKTVDIAYIPDIGYIGFHSFNFKVNSWIGTQDNQLFDLLSTILLAAGIATVLIYAIVGVIQWIKRKSLSKVDPILFILLGVYVISALFYLVFELYKVDYSPLSTASDLKASYPSSHVFIGVTYMWAAMFAAFKYVNLKKLIKIITIVIVSLFSVLMIVTRTFSGFHWFTDIIGGIMLSLSLVSLFVCFLKWWDERKGLLVR